MGTVFPTPFPLPNTSETFKNALKVKLTRKVKFKYPATVLTPIIIEPTSLQVAFLTTTNGVCKMFKAAGENVHGRFREVVMDPTNLLIKRHLDAGLVLEGGLVVLHNGIRVPMSGPYSYYGEFNNLLVINRGVHEPLEEFVFQRLLPRLGSNPIMLELGAYWGHYSMWLKSTIPGAQVTLVEPEAVNLEAGRRNFALNGLEGKFMQAFVGEGHFVVDDYLAANQMPRLSILHSDIQGFELQMLAGAQKNLSSHLIDYLFISTHNQELHAGCIATLKEHGYRVEVASDFEYETTSYDGFIFASSPLEKPLFNNFVPFRRCDLYRMDNLTMLKRLQAIADS